MINQTLKRFTKFEETGSPVEEREQSKQPAANSTLAQWVSLDIRASQHLDSEKIAENFQNIASEPNHAAPPFCFLWSASEPGPSPGVASDLGRMRDKAVVGSILPFWTDIEKQGKADSISSEGHVTNAHNNIAKSANSSRKRRRKTTDEPEPACSTVENNASAALVTDMWMWIVVMVLSCGVAFISYLDRAILGVTILPMAAELGWNESFEGAISSAFFVGYTITNVAAGWLCMQHSAKTVLQTGVWGWSLFTMLTPSAASSSGLLVLLTRFLTGAGEGVCFPALQMVVSNWVPDAQRSRSISFIFSGASLGTITAYATAPLIVKQYDWPAVFTIYGLVGMVWTLLWSLLVIEKPSIRSHEDLKGQEDTDIPWTAFARCLPLWAIIIVETSTGVGHYVCFFWQPSYYSEVYGESLQDASLLSIVPFAAAAVSTNVAGWVADALVSRNCMDLTCIRKTMQGIASFGPAVSLLLLSFGVQGNNALYAMGMFTATMLLSGCHAAGSGSQHLDINARYAAVMYGLTNGISSMLEAGGIAVTGVILDKTHSWPLMLQAVAALHIVGGVVYTMYADSRPRFH